MFNVSSFIMSDNSSAANRIDCYWFEILVVVKYCKYYCVKSLKNVCLYEACFFFVVFFGGGICLLSKLIKLIVLVDLSFN